MLKTIEDVARELATDVVKLEIVDYGRYIRWKDTQEMVAFRDDFRSDTGQWVVISNTGDQA